MALLNHIMCYHSLVGGKIIAKFILEFNFSPQKIQRNVVAFKTFGLIKFYGYF